MKSDLNILILPVRSSEEVSPMDEIFTNYPAHQQPRYVPCNMAELIVCTAWATCTTWPNGQQMNMDRMLRRRRLYSINGRDC